MKKETEVKFHDVNHDTVRIKLKELGFICAQPKTEYRCHYFHFEDDIKNNKQRWGRLKDDGNGKILIGIKEVVENKIGGVREIDLYIDDFQKGIDFFYSIGMVDRDKKIMTRELWKYDADNVEVTLDHWSELNPSIEIESDDKKTIEKYAKLLSFDINKANY